MFGNAITLFRILGFAVRVDVSWLLIASLVTWSLALGLFPERYPGLDAAVYWAMGVAGALGLFVSIVFHELCHSLVARRFGMEMKGITLFIFGGVAEMGDEPPSPRAEFLMAGAGPLSSLGLSLAALLAFFLAGSGMWAPVRGVLAYLAGINLLLAVFNTIPAFPLDGGRMLRAFLWGRHGNIRRATRVTSRLGSIFGLILIGLGVFSLFRGSFVGGMWWILIGFFLRGAASQAYRQLVLRRALEGEPVARFMSTDPVSVDPGAYLRDLVADTLYRTPHKLFPVIENGELLGCVTVDRIRGIPREKWDWTRVLDVTSACSEKNTISPRADAMDALTLMRRHNVSRLMVVDSGRLVGILSLKDLIGFLSMKIELDAS